MGGHTSPRGIPSLETRADEEDAAGDRWRGFVLAENALAEDSVETVGLFLIAFERLRNRADAFRTTIPWDKPAPASRGILTSPVVIRQGFTAARLGRNAAVNSWRIGPLALQFEWNW